MLNKETGSGGEFPAFSHDDKVNVRKAYKDLKAKAVSNIDSPLFSKLYVIAARQLDLVHEVSGLHPVNSEWRNS